MKIDKIKARINAPADSAFILQGNAAFALGVIHAGYHAATGYAGTPSTEVIDKTLAHAQDQMSVGWSVNESVAVSTGVGHAIAGNDALVTMKIPGVFQAADAITTSAFFSVDSGALVIYAATDYLPSSTQHVIDSRHFFASSRLPVLEPRNHQEMYDIPKIAADMSKKYNTPVIILTSGILAHSEALIHTKSPRLVDPVDLPDTLHDWMLLPSIARQNYNKATQERIPSIQKWAETSPLVSEIKGKDDWGIITCGNTEGIVLEALNSLSLNPSILSLGITNPIPQGRIKQFTDNISGNIYVIEDGDRFLEEKIRLSRVNVTGKEEQSVLTLWTPDDIVDFLSNHLDLPKPGNVIQTDLEPLPRPPSICPGCSYKAFALSVAKLKKQKKIYASFGDIGCSTLLFFNNALDTVSCMGASDPMRQGFVLSRPDMAHKVISVIGDSTECHSGMDGTRNAIFRNIPGVKVILDNYSTAMTGQQPAPSSKTNLAGQDITFDLHKAIEAEGGRTVVVDAYDVKKVDKALKEALKLAEEKVYTTLILEGECIHNVEKSKLARDLEFDYDNCKRCDLCNICPGIQTDDEKTPSFTSLCSNCASSSQVCLQRCPFDAINKKDDLGNYQKDFPLLDFPKFTAPVALDKSKFPKSLKIAIRGIGGQGNLFFGKVLTEVALRTPYIDTNIIKGDTLGMAQLGGSVISTFSCGDVYSSVLAPFSADALVVMEQSEVLRPGFLDLLKPGGTIILNEFSALPINANKDDYPKIEEIQDALSNFNIIHINAHQIAIDMNDSSGISTNVIIIGLLSKINPFSQIPSEIWQEAILELSPNDLIKTINLSGYNQGRTLA
ncbi:MAG: pyruvate ferredoxin oxidoreductase [Candidatus Marinimicrobia bacterium]|jgi:indolepyruvate ferredoxin oxidoreductase alpha subunit|nr:pyruvate ferredoxin oxidoreductase [Candidatus Neomarinimicrobiota bacterium]MBT5386582.1 pyruvate ferredoxin oxidoreductase [Candidatus Neomarinimicrobiota bacterium]MBT5776316.1 pyruvate ferredoxin oxidoreductase [Candidatus Neomarinimicrobiota bacterium]MBT7083350.1 pyruvate ferredoxin oxidoreductase [Candidatus Neomarinimicrobiota bacterium]MBT7920805.1 pyruvate ferredoxin oxidoreductase [Candidatus Neomarinimicrobiota bacterium]